MTGRTRTLYRGLFVACVMVLVWTVESRPACATVFGEVRIVLEQDAECQSTHGYRVHRYRVTNPSKSRSHRVRLCYIGLGMGRADIQTMERAVEVGPGSSILLTLPQPALDLGYGGRMWVFIDGKPRDESLMTVSASHGVSGAGYYHSSSHPGDGAIVLVSKNVGGAARQSLESRQSTNLSIVRADLPVSSWSTSWLGYSRYDAVVITSAELRGMPSTAREALLRATEAGGTLLVLGDWKLPEPWDRWTRAVSGGTSAAMGFGRCIVADEGAGGSLSGEVVREFGQSARKTWSPFQRPLSVAGANDMFPVVESLRVPVRALFLVVLIFVVLIGPVNLIVLTRTKHRIWMLWTVPAVSLVAAAVVFGYSLLAEGWTPERRTQVLTILDEHSHCATTIGWTAYYCPMTPGGGLHFGYETELTPQVGAGDYRDDGRARRLDWTQDQHLVSGWVTARVPAHFMVRKSELRRERLSVRYDAKGAPTVVNGLGATVAKVWVAGTEGTIWYGEDIAPGARAALAANVGARRARGKPGVLRGLYPGRWVRHPAAMTRAPQNYLRVNTYLAVIDETPFIEPGLEHARATKLTNIVYGILPEDGHAD